MMKIVDNYEFSNKVKMNLSNMQHTQDFNKILELFPKENIYIVGGFVRDAIVGIPSNDLDLFIDNLDFNEKISSFEKGSRSRLGSLKLKYPNFSIDVLSFEDIYFLEGKEKTLENVLRGVDISTSSIAYNLGDEKIWDYEAMNDINKKEVNPLNKETYIAPTISRLILHADKLGFNLGQSAKDYIKEKYTGEMDKDIFTYLDYKENKASFKMVKDTIDSIV